MNSEEKERISQDERSLLESLDTKIGKLAISLQKGTIDEFTSLFARPWKFFFINFIAGVFRGLGMAIGFTIVAALVLFVLAKLLATMVDLPIIGMYIAEIIKFVNQYMQQGIPAR